MPWRCATSCATAPRGPDTDESDPTGSDIGGPHHQREEILPCRGGDFDPTTEHVVFRPAHALRLAGQDLCADVQRGTARELRLARMACFWSLPEAVRARDAAKETP